MPITGLSCLVCGASLDESDHLPGWMGRFRALYTVLEDWNSARISSVAQRRQFEDAIPLDQSVDVDVSESTTDDGRVHIELAKSMFGEKYPPDPPLMPQPLWGFPLHDRCWELLCAADARFQEPSAVQALFDLCMSHPMQNGVLNWGHNYHGLVRYNVDVEKLLPGEEPRLLEPERGDGPHRYDPIDIPMNVADILRGSSTEAEGDSAKNNNIDKRPKSHPSMNKDPFGRLPPELLLDVVVRLDSRSVANLRLASKAVVNLGLPEKFWFSRFWPGREFEYIFERPARRAACGLWMNIYNRARDLQSHPAMQNRQRIWNLACQLRDWTILRLESPICHGLLCKSFFNPDGVNDERKWHTAEARISPAISIFSAGCRSLNDVTVTISGQTSEAWASLITLGEKRYVSGLRISQTGGKSFQLGYRHPKHEVALTWDALLEASDPFVGFHVAIDTRGIRGLRMISAQGASSCWVGDHEGVPKKFITCNGQVEALKGGFDALKMVSVSVSSLEQRPEKSKTGSGESALWYPELPDPTLQIMPVQNERVSRMIGHMPYSMCLFGGIDGGLLPYLTEIVVWVVDRCDFGIYADKYHIWALEFHYSSQRDSLEPIVFGRIPDVDPDTYERRRYQISIDSPNGERINSVDTMFQDSRFPFAMTFHTSYGRSIQIPPDFSSAVSKDDFFTATLQPTDGTIVGFFGVLKHNVVFQNLGVACITP